MYTYQDLLSVTNSEKEQKDFLLSVINDHKASEKYKTARDAELYIRQLNPMIMNYQKYLYTVSGKAIPDNYSSNYKAASNFFKRFVTQPINYLLANGVSFTKDDTKERLGKNFDRMIYEGLYKAMVGEASFLFWNVNRIEKAFSMTEFVPLWDEETGLLSSGVRFWQLASNKPLRITLFEIDGYTEFFQDEKKNLKILNPKRAYKLVKTGTQIDGVESVVGENYDGFPIVPMYANMEKQSELVGLRDEINAFDLIGSGLANDLEDIQSAFWILSNANGMEEVDLARFLYQLKRVKAAVLDDDGAKAEPHTLDVPYQAREAYLSRLENNMYYDAMAMNAKDITAGNVTATAIRAAYDNLDQKTSEMRMCVEDAIEGILKLAGIEDKPKFKLNRISNDTETTQNVLAAAQYLDHRTILEKLPFVEEEEVDEILKRTAEEEMERFESEERLVDNGRTGQGEGVDGQEAEKDGEENQEDLQESTKGD